MRSVFFVLLVLVIALGSSVAYAALPVAQEPVGEVPPEQNLATETLIQALHAPRTGEPPGFVPQQSPDPDSAPRWKLEGAPGLRGVRSVEGLPGGAAPNVALGQPGFALRSVQSFGETGVPYFEDTNHLNWPYAVATDGNNVWIVEEENGHRALKFTSDGDYLAQIGKAGISDYDEETLRNLNDVAVDGSGNVWIVDTDAAHVLKFGPDLSYVSELGELWNHGAGNDQFDQPAGVAFDAAGNIYISDGAPDWGYDAGNHRVQVFDAGGGYLATIGQTGSAGDGNDRLHGPRHLTVYGDRLYVPDSGNHRVQIFNISVPASPTYAGTIGEPGVSGNDDTHFDNPSGVAVDASFIYVADTWNHRIQIFSRSAPYAYQGTIGSDYGSGNNQFREPTDVAVDASGNIYVADYWNQRVQQFSATRTYARTYGTTGVPYLTDGAHFNEPGGLAVARDGSVYVVEERGHRLIKLDATGVPQWTVGEPGIYGGWDGNAAHFGSPQDVEIDGAGRVYVADNWNNRIQIFNPNGTHYGTLGGQWGTGHYEFDCPTGLAFGPNGELYVADACNHRIQVFNRDLVYVATMGESGVSGSDDGHFSWPQEVAVDSAGVIYVADNGNLRVQVFGPDRSYIHTIGQTGVSGDDFGHFKDPVALAVDAARRVYVGDGWANRVHVYDPTGTYLTSFAAGWGTRTGQTKRVQGLAVGPDGVVYVADSWDNHRVQKYAPGVPGWKQVNINGFGNRWGSWISSLLPFQGSLYATGYPARIWRMTTAGAWSQANTDAFGDPTNNEIDALAEFNSQLYAATYTWVCDDPSCNTGHTNGPQIWRSSNGTAWDNVTPAEGIGSGDRWVASTVVFNGSLYAGLGYGDSGHGAEIWRTGDGLTWTRVAEGGFANDIYNTDVLSLVVYNGNLYAGTRHGDWYADGHEDGGLGGEVWRSSDGETWTSANNPGFGTLEAHRVESMEVFRNELYAYVSHVGGSAAGADVWRCTEAVCDEQADWTRVADNGFDVPQNQYLYSGAVFGDYLYCAAHNPETGLQLFRTHDGSHWEKATPYDGLGSSNNRYVSNGAMTVFNNRLMLGITNDASGAGIWRNTVTADFTATPRQGPAPLTVTFENLSAGDFTTSEWDFGDGGSSTLENPAHQYAKPGLYTVSLTVGDDVDEDTLTKSAYVDTRRRVHMPLVMRDYRDPYWYDDFNNTAYDGSYNHALWSFSEWGGTPEDFYEVRQQNGVLVISSDAAPAGSSVGGQLWVARPGRRSLTQLREFEALMKLSSDRSGGTSYIALHIDSDEWDTVCFLQGRPMDSSASFWCQFRTEPDLVVEYDTSGRSLSYDTWHAVKITADPTTAEMRYYLNGALIGSHIPMNAALVLADDNLQPAIRMKNNAGASSTRNVDDVRITPAQ